ncbi:MAG: hypothetical protein JRE14_17515, partial [Deltaproteobacteria bacterium]|nr:hypothetical protein [Deltaproteobacteria bacterium]
NQIQKADDIQNAIDFGKNIKAVEGILAILHDKIDMWGNLEVVSLQEKKVEFIALK